jgi:alpha-maltose-1-phosphate synthase
MRVAIVVDWFLKYAVEQAIGLQRAGGVVLLVCREHLQEFGGDRAEWEEALARASAAGVRVVVIRGRTASVGAGLSAIAALVVALRFRPAIVHAHDNADPWLLLVTGRSKVIVTMHDPRPHPGQPRLTPLRDRIRRIWLGRSRGFVVHGELLRDALPADLRTRPVAVIPHGTLPAEAPYPVPLNPEILFFGRLEPYKGIDVLLDAMETVWRLRPNARLTIAGEGAWAGRINPGSGIRAILRHISEAELAELFGEATLVVAPYLEASQSGVVSLAVACGIPAVVSDAGALADLAVEPGLVVPVGDAQALAAALVTYLDHGPDLRRRVHALAVERLSWLVTGREALGVYGELLER